MWEIKIKEGVSGPESGALGMEELESVRREASGGDCPTVGLRGPERTGQGNQAGD